MSRIERVQEELCHQVSLIVQQELQDPRIGFVTITRAEVTPDLKLARVYFTTLDTGKSYEGTCRALDKAARFVRRRIAERMRMKFIPEIQFVYDDSQKRQHRIEEIIDIIHKEKKSSKKS